MSLDRLKKIKEKRPISDTDQAYKPSYRVPKKLEKIDSDSRKVFGFGLASGIIGAVALIMGTFIMRTPITSLYSYYSSLYLTIQIFCVIILLAAHATGLILGIVGKIRSNKTTSSNTIETLGSIFSIIGIIANSIGLTLIIIVFPITIYYSLSTPIYYLS